METAAEGDVPTSNANAENHSGVTEDQVMSPGGTNQNQEQSEPVGDQNNVSEAQEDRNNSSKNDINENIAKLTKNRSVDNIVLESLHSSSNQDLSEELSATTGSTGITGSTSSTDIALSIGSTSKLTDSPKKATSPVKRKSSMKSPSSGNIANDLRSSSGIVDNPNDSQEDTQIPVLPMDDTGLGTDTGYSPESATEEEEKAEVKSVAYTGRSTLPRSNTLSTGLASEAGGDDDDTINVVVRVRPLNANENSKKERNVMQFPGDGAIWIDTGTLTKSFTFNVTFEPEASQEDVFDHSGMKKLIEMALNGYSCTAFAFGQTGSGKTHTITGPPELATELLMHSYNDGKPDRSLQGLIPRSFHYLFKLMNESKNIGYRITASYLEIYNEQVIDLLNPSQGRQLPVRWSKNKGFYVENLFVIECEMMDDVMAVLEEGLKNRQTGSNSVNEHSSRSHSLLTLQIDSEAQDPDDENLYITKHGKLTFVDLAGSEKVKNETSATAGHLLESNNINKSLLVLGNCIAALGDAKRKSGHIPYRDSKLTKLLADSLGGNGVTLMIACVSPSACNSFESLNTLRYANRAKKIKTKPVVKMDPREKLILSLKREIKVLRQENHYLRQQLEFPIKPRGQLQKENDERFMRMLKDQQETGEATVTDHGLYEMLQEYMIENETLRNENSDLHQMKDQSKRDQQILARENEKLIRKLDDMERERYYANTPVSIYSVNSSRHGSATGPPWGFPPEQLSRNSTSDSWQSYKQLPGYDGQNGQTNGFPPPGGSRRTTPPAGISQKKKPPHRLAEPIKSPRYDGPPQAPGPPGGGYNARYQQMASPREGYASPRGGIPGPARGPQGPPSNYQGPPAQYPGNPSGPAPRGHPNGQFGPGPPPSHGPSGQGPPSQGPPPPHQHQPTYAKQPPPPHYQQHPNPQHPQQQHPQQRMPPPPPQQGRQDAPVPQPRRSKGSQGSSQSSVSIPSDHGSATLSTSGSISESTHEMNERLKRELMDLEGEIHSQTKQIQQPKKAGGPR